MKQENKATGSWFTRLMVIVLIIAMSTISWWLIAPIANSYVISSENLAYTSDEVFRLCEIFEFSMNGEFCMESEIQNTITLKSELESTYPIESSHYTDVSVQIQHYPSIPSDYCHSQPSDYVSGFAVGNCPSPSECSEEYVSYFCTFDLSMIAHNTLIRLEIDQKSGRIQSYWISSLSDS